MIRRPPFPPPPMVWSGILGGGWGSGGLPLDPGRSGALLGAPGCSWALLGAPGESWALLGGSWTLLGRYWVVAIVFIVFPFVFSMIFDMRLLISLRLFSLLSWFAFSLPLFLSRFSLVLSFLQAPRDAPQPTVPQGGAGDPPDHPDHTIRGGCGGGPAAHHIFPSWGGACSCP